MFSPRDISEAVKMAIFRHGAQPLPAGAQPDDLHVITRRMHDAVMASTGEGRRMPELKDFVSSSRQAVLELGQKYACFSGSGPVSPQESTTLWHQHLLRRKKKTATKGCLWSFAGTHFEDTIKFWEPMSTTKGVATVQGDVRGIWALSPVVCDLFGWKFWSVWL
jgi:hypothetical protein